MARVFVYGSLMTGMVNHRVMEGATALGPATTEPRYALVDLGPYPALVEDGTTAITGELYEVSPALLARLDDFEGHPRLYRRRPVAVQGGHEAQAYFFPAHRLEGKPRVESGDWRSHLLSRPP